MKENVIKMQLNCNYFICNYVISNQLYFKYVISNGNELHSTAVVSI